MKKATKLFFLCFTLTGLMLGASACRSNQKTTGEEPTSRADNNTSLSTEADTAELTPTPAIPAGDYDYSLVINGSDSYDISDLLYGLFFEDINYAIDGGLYAEKIKNRSFEYGKMATNGERCGWKLIGDASFEVIDGSTDGSSLNENNQKYAQVVNTSGIT